jgi:hypothetical protein
MTLHLDIKIASWTAEATAVLTGTIVRQCIVASQKNMLDLMSAFGGKADITVALPNVCL